MLVVAAQIGNSYTHTHTHISSSTKPRIRHFWPRILGYSHECCRCSRTLDCTYNKIASTAISTFIATPIERRVRGKYNSFYRSHSKNVHTFLPFDAYAANTLFSISTLNFKCFQKCLKKNEKFRLLIFALNK